MAYEYSTAKKLPARYKTVAVMRSRGLGATVIGVVKLVRMSAGLITCEYALSDDIEEPGVETFFLVETNNFNHKDKHWLVEGHNVLWPVLRILGLKGMPMAYGCNYTVTDERCCIDTDEHNLIQSKIKSYVEQK